MVDCWCLTFIPLHFSLFFSSVLLYGNYCTFFLLLINRDIVKKKRDEQLKMVWRVSPAHKKLQTRMEQMRKFRRQHEQLRTVIVRVLRPTVVKTTTLADGDTADLKPEMDAADLNAIEEVRQRLLF